MKNYIRLASFLWLLLVPSFTYANSELPSLSHYWLQAAPPNVKNQAAYVTINNTSSQDIVLVDAYSPAFEMTMIHQTVIQDGIAKMQHQDKIIIKSGKKLTFKPGGYHIMLMQPTIKFSQGDFIKINLIYRINDKKVVQVTWFPVELH